jgi:fatty acid desaturase
MNPRVSPRELAVFSICVNDLYERPLLLPIAQCITNLMLYASMAWFVALPTWQPFSFVLWPLMGLILTGFLAAAHDCVHSTFVNTKRGNRIAGAIWCTPILMNFTIFKSAHLTHHRFTRVPGDTEPIESLDSIRDYLRHVIILNPLRSVPKIFRMALGFFPPNINSSRRRQAAQADAWGVILWLLLVGTFTVIHPVFVIAIFWSPLFFSRTIIALTSLPEHYGCSIGPKVLQSTRTILSNFLVRTILWNGNFHVEHHLYPAIPSCNLPKLSRRLEQAPVLRINSYLRFHLDLLSALLNKTKH